MTVNFPVSAPMAYFQPDRFVWLAIFLLAVLFIPAAHAERALQRMDAEPSGQRVALVIGNATYKDSPLKNPVNDARAVAGKLRGLGFDVIEKHNLTQKQIGRTLSEFRSKLSPGGTALFFYAGHGVQVDGINYLPAVDADIGAEEDVPTQAIDVDKVLKAMEGGKTRVNLVFLDACRNNPYARSFRSAGEGLAKVSAPSGTLIFYATRPGSVAADGDGQNGLYTQNLLTAMDVPGLTVEQVQKRVASGVRQASRGRQEPWMEGLLEGDFYFRPGAIADPQPEPARPPIRPIVVTPATPAVDPAEAAYWAEVKKSDDPDYFAAYLATYPNGLHVADANEYLSRDKQAKAAREKLKEDQAWQKAQSGESYTSYEAYLKVYPNGRYAAVARLKQSKLRPARASYEPEMVAIPGKDYEMGKTEVTQAQWRAVMGNNPSYFSSCGDDCPVEKVSWDDIQDYLKKLNQMSGGQYRLPNEDEWKHACDGGSSQEYCGSNNLDAVSWYDKNSGGKTRPVGQKHANGYGLYDMTGNVWEWQQDCYDGDCSERVLRGGSWSVNSGNARAANRNRISPSRRDSYDGFRVARSARTF